MATGISSLMVAAINSATTLNVSAASGSTSERVDLFGAANARDIDFIVFGDVANITASSSVAFPRNAVQVTPLDGVTDPIADGNALRDAILGTGITPVGDARLTTAARTRPDSGATASTRASC